MSWIKINVAWVCSNELYRLYWFRFDQDGNCGCNCVWYTEETPCSRIRCFPQSRCVENEKGQAECRCLPGFQEVDNECLPISSLPSNITTHQDCRHDDRCDVNAQCVYNSVDDQYRCQCHRGYVGDGLECSRESLLGAAESSIHFHFYLIWVFLHVCSLYCDYSMMFRRRCNGDHR